MHKHCSDKTNGFISINLKTSRHLYRSLSLCVSHCRPPPLSASSCEKSTVDSKLAKISKLQFIMLTAYM